MKVYAVIPCYNEASFITEVVNKIKGFVDSVIVSDDASTDNTVSLALSAGALVCQNMLP